MSLENRELRLSKDRECVVVAAVLANPTAKLPPNICTALAYAPDFWDCVEAGKVAEGINRAIRKGRPTHPVVVGLLCDHDYRGWAKHPMFGERSWLPLDLAEVEAQLLVKRYANKRLVNIMANAYEQVLNRPEKARHVALDLKLKLEAVGV